MAHSFKDASGQEWHPRIVCRTLLRYEEETDVCLLQAGDDLFRGKLGNVLKLAFLSCERQARERRIAFEAFCEGFASPAHIQTVGEALGVALENFFLKSPESKLEKAPASPGAGGTSTL